MGPMQEKDTWEKGEGKRFDCGEKGHLRGNDLMEKGTENKIKPLMSFDKDTGNQGFLFSKSYWEPSIYLRMGPEKKEIAFLGQL